MLVSQRSGETCCFFLAALTQALWGDYLNLLDIEEPRTITS
jgi:hypothetical protein